MIMMIVMMMMMVSRGGDGAVIDSSRRTPLYYAVEKAGMSILLKGLKWLLLKYIFCLNHLKQNVHPRILGIHSDSPDPA